MEVTKFSDLKEELVSDILARLSANSLKKLSCVNKSWNSLIQSSSFVSRHYLHQCSYDAKFLIKRLLPDSPTVKNVLSLLNKKDDYNHSEILDFPFEENVDLFVTGPCISHIVCLKDRENFIALWNPAIGDCRRLPECSISYPRDQVKPHLRAIGFGWISETNDYKVVIVMRFQPRGNYYDGPFLPPEAFVYSLSTDCWKQLSHGGSFADDYRSSSSPWSNIYFNGACYWAGPRAGNICTYKIFWFHMRDEVFGCIQTPTFESKDLIGDVLSLSVIDGCIALILKQKKGRESCFDLWVLTEYGVEESWT